MASKTELKNGMRRRGESLGLALSFAPAWAWTLSSVALAFAGMAFLAVQNVWPAFWAFLLACSFDVIDGAVARATRSASGRGAFIDGVADRYVELMLFTGMLFLDYPKILFSPQVWIMLLASGAFMTPFVKAYAAYRTGADRKLLESKGNLLERSERVILLLVSLAAYAYNPAASLCVVIATAVLSHATALQRIRLVMAATR